MPQKKPASPVVLLLDDRAGRRLATVLQEIRANYQLRPEDLHPKIAAVWYSTRGCASARMTPDETREWLAHLHGFKSENVARIDRWVATLTAPTTEAHRLELSSEDAAALMIVLNDQRLLLAARQDIGEAQMTVQTLTELRRLPLPQRKAVFDIHFLAAVIAHILDQMPGAPGDWAEG